MYYNVEGVPLDYQATISWYYAAAKQGREGAMDKLGAMFADGQVPQDYVQAHKWLNLAASRKMYGNDRYMSVRNRDRVAAKMTPVHDRRSPAPRP
jgi:TPR repeat protein